MLKLRSLHWKSGDKDEIIDLWVFEMFFAK